MRYFTISTTQAASRKAASMGFDPRNSQVAYAHAYRSVYALMKANRIRRMVKFVSRGTSA